MSLDGCPGTRSSHACLAADQEIVEEPDKRHQMAIDHTYLLVPSAHRIMCYWQCYAEKHVRESVSVYLFLKGMRNRRERSSSESLWTRNIFRDAHARRPLVSMTILYGQGMDSRPSYLVVVEGCPVFKEMSKVEHSIMQSPKQISSNIINTQVCGMTVKTSRFRMRYALEALGDKFQTQIASLMRAPKKGGPGGCVSFVVPITC